MFDPFSILGTRLKIDDWNRYVLESRGNVIVWTGPGSYSFPAPPGFTITTDEKVWNDAKKAWLGRHPGVARTV
jgi:hypothetical protein